jgi:DNA invertase Pin-like site-specific DNA recombinase
MKTLAITYSRVSSKDQEKGFSLESQTRTARQYAASKDFQILKEFTIRESARKQGRKHFNEMVAFLRQHPEVRVLIVEKTDRLSRNLHDFVAIEDLVEELGIEIHLVKEGQVLRKSARSQDRLVQGIFALLARNYIQNMLEEIVKGQTIKAEKGQYPGRAPLGYRHDREHRTIVADPMRSSTIRLIFDLYASGSFTIKTLRQAIIDRTGERISKSYLHHILTSRFYTGVFRWRGRQYSGTHPKLIDLQTFDHVQGIVAGRGKPKPRKHHFSFGGLMHCALDDCAVTAEQRKHRYIYYHCSFGRGRHDFPYLKEEEVAELLGSVLNSLKLPSGLALTIEAQNDEAHSANEASRRQETSKLNQRLTALKTRMGNAFREKSDHPDDVDEDVFRECMEQWKAERKQVEADLQGASESPSDDRALSADRIIELAEHAHEIYQRQDNDRRAELLKMVLTSCKTDGQSFHPEFRGPFGMLFPS